jgi:4-hydroxy-tetrahydrodipicolinate reductase
MVKAFLVGYGRMGKKIENLANAHGLVICGHASSGVYFEDMASFKECDVVIEFTRPEAAVKNLQTILAAGKPVVSGTTGWLEDWGLVEETRKRHDGRLFYASNFSFGANVVFYLNEKLAELMSKDDSYAVSIKEIHHTGKKDKPSGTAATLADGIIHKIEKYNQWSVDTPGADQDLVINCLREENVKGFHEVHYKNDIDEIMITHNAFTRDGFAIGAIKAALWLSSKEGGSYNMKDLMGLK